MRRFISALVFGSVVLTFAPNSHAVSEPVQVALGGRGQLVDQGRAVDVRVVARCEPGLVPLEAFVTVSQEGVSSDFGFFPLSCDGTRQRFRVRVNTFDDTRFQRGKAFGSAFVLVEDPGTGDTSQAQDSRVVELR
jgi:hypothetical protein